jgi:hypothetical protein
MNEKVILDDDFVLGELHGLATSGRELVSPVGPRREARHRIEDTIARCCERFDRHRGFSYLAAGPGDLLSEQKLLRRGLDLVGLVLGLERSLPLFERIVEVDWRAHLDLDKEKRYRDHITHPVRVTAIGWWLLHRADRALLESMAAHYEQSTLEYRSACGIDLGGHSWEDLVQYAWLAGGLLHDSMYPMEYHLRAGERLGEQSCDALGLCAVAAKLHSPGDRRRLVEPLRNSWFTSQRLLLEQRLSTLPSRQFKHAHAILGALHHLHASGDRLHTLQGLILQMAARAIVTHHDKEETAIVTDPLALLLYISDNLQAWKRPFLFAHALPGQPGSHGIRPIVECERIELIPEGSGYDARFWMNPDPRDMEILKNDPYRWRFEDFRVPNHRLQELIARQATLPPIRLAEPTCVMPNEFFEFMKDPAS